MTNKRIREEIAKFHPYEVSVSHSKQFEGKLTTNVTCNSTRKKVIANSWPEMLQKLKSIYEIGTDTLVSLFPVWLDWKAKRNSNKPETLDRNRKCFEKLVKNHRISLIPLNKLTVKDLEEWAVEVATDHPMSRKVFTTNVLPVSGVLSYAFKQGIIDQNPWERVDLSPKLFKTPQRAPSKDKVFTDDEFLKLKEALLEAYYSNHNTANLAWILNMNLGLRVGELAALKWEDIDDNNRTVFIRRQESDGTVEDKVKADSSGGYRELVLNQESMDILALIDRSDSYIFLNANGERISTHSLHSRLVCVQRNLFGKVRRSHAIRRTIASHVNDALGLEEARRQLGHSNTETTYNYIYSTRGEAERRSFFESLPKITQTRVS